MSEPFISTICRVLEDVFSPGTVEIACDGGNLMSASDLAADVDCSKSDASFAGIGLSN